MQMGDDSPTGDEQQDQVPEPQQQDQGRAPQQQAVGEGQAPGQPGGEGQQGGEGRGRRFGKFKPLRVGEELDVKIETKGEKGDGIAKVKGLVLFVAGGEPGQDVRVKVVRVFRNFAVGEIIA